MTARIGIFGGTFDPIHYGHLAIAEDARSTLNLDRVLFIPAARQPFKRDRMVAPAAQRLAMVEHACADNLAFEPSAIELERSGISYTVATLETLAQRRLGDLFFILGADALRDLPRWYQIEHMLTLAQFVAIGRPDVAVDQHELGRALPMLADRLTVLDGPQINLSSTELRQRIAQRRSVRYLMPDSVIDYIEQHSLYREEA